MNFLKVHTCIFIIFSIIFWKLKTNYTDIDYIIIEYNDIGYIIIYYNDIDNIIIYCDDIDYIMSIC